MLLFTAITVPVHMLNVLRNAAFMTLVCGALGASLDFSLKGRTSALSWFPWLAAGSVTLLVASFSHMKHQMLGVVSHAAPAATGATLESTVQQSGDSVMRACLLIAGVFIVFQGLRLLVLFSLKRMPNAPLIIVRYFVGALICLGILGIGLLGHATGGASDAREITKNSERYLSR